MPQVSSPNHIPTVLLIGASRGLGHAMAAEFLKKGWNVVGTVRGSSRTLLHDLVDAYPNRVDIELLDITRPEQIIPALTRAMQVLTDPAECGPVTLALCQDVQAEAYDYPESFFTERLWTPRRPRADRAELKAAAEALKAAKKPLIVASGGVLYSGASDALARFSAATGIPVCETQGGKSALPDDDALNMAADEPGPERTTLARDELRRVQAALDRLPPRRRQAVYLRQVEGLSRREIATRMGIGEETVKEYLAEGLFDLAELLFSEPTDMRRRP